MKKSKRLKKRYGKLKDHCDYCGAKNCHSVHLGSS